MDLTTALADRTRPDKLLVVHPVPAVRLALVRALEADGWSVQATRSGELALDRLAADPGTAVLLYWDLPRLGALTFILRLRHRMGALAPALLAFATRWYPDGLRRAVQLGVAGFLVKPVEPRTVRAEVRALRQGEDTPSRARLLRRAAPALLAPDDHLWLVGAGGELHAPLRDLAAVMCGNLRRAHGLAPPNDGTDLGYLELLFRPIVAADPGMDGPALGALVAGGAMDACLERADRARLVALPPETWSRVVDRVRLGQVKDDLRERLGAWDVDLDRAFQDGDLPDLAGELDGLPTRTRMRLRVLALMLKVVREGADQAWLVERLAPPEEDVVGPALLGAALERTREEAGQRALRSILGVRGAVESGAEVAEMIEAGRFSAAYYAISCMQEGDPRAIPLLSQLEQTMRRAGRAAEVEGVYDTRVQLRPGDLEALCRLATLKAEHGDFAGALAALARAERLDPEAPSVRALRTSLTGPAPTDPD